MGLAKRLHFERIEEIMAETKYGKYIITEYQEKAEAPWTPEFKPGELIPLLFLDSRVVKGAFYVESNWTMPPFANESHGESHSHDYDEVLAFFGSDPEHPHDLNGVAEVHLGDEVHTVTKSCLIFVPKGTRHGPIDFKRIDRPIFHFACGTGQVYF
jgi:hypothetical protein